jgi:hypothetical protein
MPGVRVVIEMVACYGMPVGAEVFETCVWIGRYLEALGPNSVVDGYERVCRMKRQAVKLHLCHSNKANDATIRQALIDRFGPTKLEAIGNKAAPGPLYGVKADVWAALALAVTHWDTQKRVQDTPCSP